MQTKIIIDMAVTRLKRKDRRNKAVANNKVEAISLGADANHRIAFARAVPQWKKWFDEMLVTPSKSTSK